MTDRHYFMKWSVNPKNVSNFETFFKCRCKNHQVLLMMMKVAVMRTFTGKEDPDLPLLQRIS